MCDCPQAEEVSANRESLIVCTYVCTCVCVITMICSVHGHAAEEESTLNWYDDVTMTIRPISTRTFLVNPVPHT